MRSINQKLPHLFKAMPDIFYIFFLSVSDIINKDEGGRSYVFHSLPEIKESVTVQDKDK